MKTFTRISILVLVMIISSAVVFAQGTAKKTTISDVELQMMQKKTELPANVGGEPTDFLAVPITSFPYFQDFESGWPAEMDDVSGSYSDAFISGGSYAYQGNTLFLEGGTSTGWGSTPYSYSAAFDPSKSTHFGTVSMDVVPDGSMGNLMLYFDFAQGYSFNSNYSWFRVLVNGAVVYNESGSYYWQPWQHIASSSWVTNMEFDLSGFQGAPFNLQLQSSCKYYTDYYYEGDWAAIDNLKLYYMLPPGDLEGYVTTGGGLSINGATVGMEGWGVTTTDPTGYYFMGGAFGGNQEAWAWKDGYNMTVDPVWVEPMSISQHDFILTAPTMFITPTFHTYTLNPEEFFTTQTGITNTGDGPLEWFAEVIYPVTDFEVTNVQPRVNTDPTLDASPYVRTVQVINPVNNRDMWDIVLQFNTADNSGEAGVETDGNFIWTTMWNGTGFQQYDMTGAHIGPFSCGGVGSLRDLAYDGTYMYGGPASNSVSQMDFTTGTLVGTINAATATRAIAYNDDNMTFYSNNWDTDITEWDMTGAFVSSFPVGANGSLYGMAYDNQLPDGPFLWAFSQDGDVAAKYDLATGQQIETVNVKSLAGATQIAGGMFTHPVENANGDMKWSLGCNFQNEMVAVFELADYSGGGVGSWLTLDWYTGVNPGFGQIDNVPTNFDAAGTSPGEVYTADLVFTSNPDVGTSTIPCTMIIAGDPLVAPTDLTATLIDDVTGIVQLSWNFTTDLTFLFFKITRNGQLIATSTTNGYIDNLPAGGYGEYCYKVQAEYVEGTSQPVGPECIEWPLPELYVDPDFHEAWVWSDHQYTWNTNINNVGIGTLQFTFPNYITDDFDCTHEIEMFDDWGDGWNGGYFDLYLDGVLTMSNVTLAGGAGPESVYFTASVGQEITTVWVDGGWPYECSYFVYDGEGNLIGQDGAGGAYPNGIGAGECYAFCPVPSYIVDVTPATGLVGEGSSQEVAITWDATGFPPGDYPEDLLLESNDPNTPEFYIGNLMHVYDPGEFVGLVTDCESGFGLPGVTVTAVTDPPGDSWQTVTDNGGAYSLYVDPGVNIDIYFDKLGYESVMVDDTFAIANTPVTVDAVMCEAPNPVPWVLATVNYPDEIDCLVEWALPEGPYELIYDDGSAEDFFVWSTWGHENAVKMTPAGYPAEVFGGRVYVGDGTFPAGNWLNTTFRMYIYDDNGTNDLPGTVLDSVDVIVTNYGWIEFSFIMGATLDDGEFYLSMMQLGNYPDAAPIGIDQQMPMAYRSYSRMAGTEWASSVYQDFMIRAYVNGPQTDAVTDEGKVIYPAKVSMNDERVQDAYHTMNNSPFLTMPGTEKAGTTRTVQGYEATDAVDYYLVSRVSDFDPNLGPAFGTHTPLAQVGTLDYLDAGFQGLAMGWYAYGVQVFYTSGLVSPIVYSNTVGRDMDVQITFEVTLCDGNDPEDVEITLTGEDWPYETFFGVTDATGIYVFNDEAPHVWKGAYNVNVFKIGYEAYTDNMLLMSDQTIQVILSEKRYPPRNLWVDPLTSYAYWDPPLVMAVDENFEKPDWPPIGWQSTTNGIGWQLYNTAYSGDWTVPAWNSQYALANDDIESGNDGSVDYLITPPMDLREVDTYHLMFDSYYDGAYGQLATVEYSYDAGATWDVLYGMPPAMEWTLVDVDLAAYSGLTAPEPLWIAFHADDGGAWASGWAIDNVLIANGETDPISYHVYLDGAFVIETDTTFYQYEYLTYGVTYTASVAARYSCGLSPEIYYTWTSGYLAPPRNLDGSTQDDANLLWWEPPLVPDSFFDVISEEVRTEFPNPMSEYSPMVRTINVTGSGRDTWDLQIVFPCGDASGEAGVETDGNYVYTTKWNAGNGTFFQYEMDGTFNGPVTVPGCQDIRDLAYNDNDGLFYGSNAGTTVWGINFETLSVDNTVSAPTAARAIAYDNDANGLWANNWDTDITLFDMSGAMITSFAVSGAGSFYGFAYDYWTDNDNPYLWGYSQDGSGADLIQMDINAGGSQIFTQPTGPIVGGTEIAGGLYTHCGAYENQKVTIGGIRQNDVIWAIELAECSAGPVPPSLVVPDNLIGYKLYRDMDNIAYIPYDGEDTTYYWDFDLLPLCYIYEVSAIYDLTKYGFPGDTGESALEGPKEICTEYGWPLPFVEEWSTGSYDPNLWTAGENWRVNGQIGNPEPSTEFTWDPVLSNYKSSLTSYAIDGKYHPNSDDEYIDGRIWFDFEVSLDDVNATGNEKLVVDVWENGTWHHLITFDNADGGFDWAPQHHEISNWAFGEIFRVRFTAEGNTSSDILSWFIDNINIYRQCDAATELEATVDFTPYVDNSVYLTWTPPVSGGGSGGGEWIMWDDGTYVGGIGLTGGGTFSYASHWDPDMIAQYDGQYLTKIRFVAGAQVVATDFTLKVWEGANAGTLLYEEALSGLILGDWNEITLSSPVELDVTQELWFGLTVVSADGDFPAAHDAGPAVVAYGDMISLDGATWDPISSFGAQFDVNWNLQAWVGDMTDGSSVPMTPMVDNTVYTTPNASVNSMPATVTASIDEQEGTRELTGYNIYWNEDNAGSFEYVDFTTDSFYLHTAADPFTVGSLQCYYIEAVYEDCEAPSEEACVIITGIEDPELSNEISVYPNPARDILNITSTSDITHVTVMNYVGQVVYNQKVVEDNNIELNVSTYETGVYMVKVETSTGIRVEKITIAH